MKISFKALSAIIFLVLLIVGGIWAARLVWFRPADIDHFFFRSLYEQTENDPEALSYYHGHNLDNLNIYNHKLTDVRPGFYEKQNSLYKHHLEQLKGYSYSSLSTEQQLSYDILEKDLSLKIAGAPFLSSENIIAPFWGIQSQLPMFLAYFHRVSERQEAHQYLLRLDVSEQKIDFSIDRLKELKQKGALPPQFLIEEALVEMEAFVTTPTKENLVYTSFGRRSILTHYQMYNEGEAARHLNLIEERLDKKVYPAFRRMITETKKLREVASAISTTSLPTQEYPYYLEKYAGTTGSADSLIAVGKTAVLEIQDQIRQEAQLNFGHSPQDVGAYLHRLEDSLSRPQTYEKFQDGTRKIMLDARDKIQGAISIKPTEPRVIFHEFASFHAEHAPDGYYLPPSVDGSRQPTILLHDDSSRIIPPWKMRTFVFRNIVPGTHWRWLFQVNNDQLPLFRRMANYPDYEAAWSAYADFLANELGLHAIPNTRFGDHPYSRIGHLQSRLLDAAALVVDPSIHQKGWSRQQGIEYLLAECGISEKEAQRRVDEMFSIPGKACGYHLGLTQILSLREKAKSEMGLRYTPAAFHELLLKNGAMPMSVVTNMVDAWAKP